MRVLIDTTCSHGHASIDVWAERGGPVPACACGEPAVRLFRTAPSMTPGGTRAERGRDLAAGPTRVDTKAIALETTREIEQKMLRFRDPVVAEEHVRREISGHLETPLPTPGPITFTNPASVAA